jgi:uncharacterized protein
MSATLMDTDSPPNVPPDGAPTSDTLRPSGNHATLDERHRETFLSPLNQIFMGPRGPYPGTRWLIYIILGFVALSLFDSVLSILRPPFGYLLPWRMGQELSLMLAAIVPAFLMARLEGCRFGDFGLPAKTAFGRNFCVGALWGFGSLTVFLFFLRIGGAFSLGGLAQQGTRILKFAFFWAVFFLIAAFFEDFLLRGYSQWVLSRGMNFWPAAAVLSILFGLIHLRNAGETYIGIAGVIAIGLFFCLTLWRTGTLWWAIGFHMAWDWGESFLYSVPDSGGMVPGHLLNSSMNGPKWLTGGSVGPEGSFLVFALLAVLWILFSRAYPEVKYGAPENRPSPQASNFQAPNSQG